MMQKNMWLGLVLMACALMMGCGEDFSYDASSYFVEDWRGSYTQTKNCFESMSGHTGFVEVWIDDASSAAYMDRTQTPPEGAVLLKPQYDGADCSEPTSYTAMRKTADGWDWQRVNGDGSVAESGQIGACSSCHASCEGAICTMP